MVENKKPLEVCLEPYKPIAKTYYQHDIFEEVTEPDVAPSLYQMISTATVGSMPGNSRLYTYPDLGDDDEAHEHPDYEQLNKSDIVEKENFARQFAEKPENYEKTVDVKDSESSKESKTSEEETSEPLA